jgi:hypothetical protein
VTLLLELRRALFLHRRGELRMLRWLLHLRRLLYLSLELRMLRRLLPRGLELRTRLHLGRLLHLLLELRMLRWLLLHLWLKLRMRLKLLARLLHRRRTLRFRAAAVRLVRTRRTRRPGWTPNRAADRHNQQSSERLARTQTQHGSRPTYTDHRKVLHLDEPVGPSGAS